MLRKNTKPIKCIKFLSCYPMGEGPNGLSLVYAQGVSLHKVSLDRNEQDTVQPYKSRIVYISRKCYLF